MGFTALYSLIWHSIFVTLKWKCWDLNTKSIVRIAWVHGVVVCERFKMWWTAVRIWNEHSAYQLGSDGIDRFVLYLMNKWYMFINCWLVSCVNCWVIVNYTRVWFCHLQITGYLGWIFYYLWMILCANVKDHWALAMKLVNRTELWRRNLLGLPCQFLQLDFNKTLGKYFVILSKRIPQLHRVNGAFSMLSTTYATTSCTL